MATNREGAIQMWRDFLSDGEGNCGPGSSERGTQEFIPFLTTIIKKHHIQSISDAGCGSFDWMSTIDLGGVKYIGYDINDIMLQENRLKYPKVAFKEFDIVHQVLPKTDLIICRDCLFHLPNRFVIKALNGFRNSGSKFLIATSADVSTNIDFLHKEEEYSFRKINLQIAPFILGTPIDCLEEKRHRRLVCLWQLN